MTLSQPVRVGLVGVGKIARDQHIPVMAHDPDFRLVAVASRHSSIEGVAAYPTLADMLAGEPDLDAIALCNTPQARFATAFEALQAGKHVLLEKPPGSTLSEIDILTALAARKELTLFATWHSRFASGVAPARAWLESRRILSVRVDWREDVRHWHPGQAWIWEPGGFGVFDPGINALSIVTAVLPRPFFLKAATLDFPSNRASPIAAELDFEDAGGLPIHVGLDWLQTGPQTWNIVVVTDDGELVLSSGGAKLTIQGREVVSTPDTEYAGIYRRFAELIRAERSDVDVSPLRHVADAFLLGRRIVVSPFED
jgi:D-galactose 1-dehydrogenase